RLFFNRRPRSARLLLVGRLRGRRQTGRPAFGGTISWTSADSLRARMGEMGKRLAFALLITVFVLGALLGLNLAFVEVITGPTRWAALPLATASALLAAAAGAWFASVRSGRQVTATLVGTVLVCLVGAR